MIAALKRWLLEREVLALEADIAGIRKQRENDTEVESALVSELAIARRKLQIQRLSKLTTEK